MKALTNTLNKAIRRRARLSSITNAMRLVNGVGDGLDGLLIDRYNKHLHIQVLKDHWHKQMDEICHLLASSMPVEYLIVKYRNSLPLAGRVREGDGDPRTIVEEHGIKFEVNLNDGLNCGLFLDMRHNRQMVGQCCKGKKVLNCFSYTCSFGVHARVGGAVGVINTDISRKILERGKNNYRLNALSTASGEFIQLDTFLFLQRAFKKGIGFDMIILDPPSFARHGGQVFQVKRDLPKLIALAVAVLNPGGMLLVTTNYSEISHADLERMLAAGVKSSSRGHIDRRVERIQRVGQDEDFIGSNSFKESFLAGLWVKFL
jgi:23S rRNA (cytosine1962-C5)-methyltransferase